MPKKNLIQIDDPHILAVANQVLHTIQLCIEKAIVHNENPNKFPISSNPKALEQEMLKYIKKRSQSKIELATKKVLSSLSADSSQRRLQIGELVKVDLTSSVSIEEQISTLQISSAAKWPKGHMETLSFVNKTIVSIPKRIKLKIPHNSSSAAPIKSITWEKANRKIKETPVASMESAIQDKYNRQAEALGAPKGNPIRLSNGWKQMYEKGSIYYSPKTDAHVIYGPIREKWLALGAEGGFLGYPITDTLQAGIFNSDVIPDKPGRYNYFEHGAIYWSEQTGAHEIHGAILSKWEEKGGEGTLGYPLTDESITPDKKGRYNHFERGSIYWTPATGAHTIGGNIRDKWASLGWEKSFLGYPTTDQTQTWSSYNDGYIHPGYFNHFEHGSIYATLGGEAHIIYGAIRDKWASLGWEKSFLGFPTTDESGTPDGVGRYNHFQGGSIYWTSQTGAYEVHGDIRSKWESLGWEKSYLGYPLTDESITPDGIGRFNHFQGGSIYWTPNTGANAVKIQIRDKWESLGWEMGYLGYPLNDTQGSNSATLSNTFQGGFINWSQSSGAQASSPYTKINFIIDKLHCLEETGSDWAGSDEIVVSGAAIDEYLNGVPLGQIRKNADSGKVYSVGNSLASFTLGNPGWPKGYMVTVLLMEDEGDDGIGGLSDAQQSIINKTRDEVVKALTTAGVAALGTLIGTSLGSLATPIGAIIGAVIGYIVGELISWLISLFEDQWFPPAISIISLPSVHTLWNGSKSSPQEVLDYGISGGHYHLYVHWEFAK